MKVYFGGDVVPTNQNSNLFISGNAKKLFGKLNEITKDADAYIVNLECCLTDNDAPIIKKGPNIKAPTKSINGIKAAGITHVALANNHSVDHGIENAKEMLNLLTENGIGYVGIGENDSLSRAILYIEKNGVKIGVVNVCEHEYTYAKQNAFGANPFNYLKTVEDVKTAKQNADYVVVLFHGGKEYCRYPSPRLMDACRLLAVAGANLVLCQHTHCISCFEEYAGCHILYGQGNYHFCWNKEFSAPECWNTGLLAKVTATKTEFKVEYYPTYVTGDTIDLAEGELANEILSKLYSRNEELKNGKWVDGWKAFVKTVEQNYRNAIENAFKDGATESEKEMFPHFYDCEAHQDVLRELYPSWHSKN